MSVSIFLADILQFKIELLSLLLHFVYIFLWLSVLTQLPPVPAAAIEACLGHLLKRRAAGFLRSDKIAALFTKVGKVCDTAGEVCRKVQEQLQQQADLSRLVTQMSPTPPVALLLLSAVLNSPKSVPRQP